MSCTSKHFTILTIYLFFLNGLGSFSGLEGLDKILGGLLPYRFERILPDFRVNRNERHAFGEGLRDVHAVVWVAMDVRKACSREDVIHGDRDEGHAQSLDVSKGIYDGVASNEKTTATDLVQHLPDGSVAEKYLIGDVFQQG